MDQDQASAKLDMRKTDVGSCALNRRGYVHKKMGGRTQACPSVFCIHNMASRRQKSREEVAVGPGPRMFKAGHETKNCGEFYVRWGGLSRLGKGGQKMSVPMWVLQTVHNFRKTEKREKFSVGP